MFNKKWFWWFEKFDIEEIFTEYIFMLMQCEQDFMVFVDNKQILIGEEVDEWNKNNGLMDPTERLLYHKIENGYVVNYTNGITSLLIPGDMLKKTYSEFIAMVKESLKEI